MYYIYCCVSVQIFWTLSQKAFADLIARQQVLNNDNLRA